MIFNFRNWVLQTFPFLEDDFDALTDYELFCKMVEYMRESLEKVKTFDNQLLNFQNKLNELEEEINNFNVQEEVNNKLDEMLESGQLAEIISQFLTYTGVLAFNNKEELKNSTIVVNGSIAKTLGDVTYNDGLGNFWKIRNILNTDIIDDINILQIINDNTLVAEKIINPTITSLLEDVKKIDYNKSHQLSDNVQSFLSNIDISTTFPDDYSIAGFVIINDNNQEKGIVVANDWSIGGSGGNKFTIKTFDLVNNVISNITTKLELINGHANGICKIDESHILIIAIAHNYVYDITNNTIKEITNNIPYVRSCANYKDKIYITTDYDHVNDIEVNKMYEVNFDENYNPTVINEYTLENLYSNLKMQNQGMVIYDDLIIFPSYNDVRLVIYDFNTHKHLKTQVFTAPYMVEYENGIVYDNKLLLNDGYGKIYEPDIYGKRTYGDYNNNTIARSISDICLYDEVIKLDGNQNREITINFNKFLTFSANPNTNKGTLGSMLESITMYVAIRNFRTSGVVHNAVPIEIPLYKNIEYESDTFNFLEKHFETSYTLFNENNNKYEKSTICGTYSFGEGDTIPTITLRLAPYILNETFDTSGNQTVEISTDSNYCPVMYITKIIGHRKIGKGY